MKEAGLTIIWVVLGMLGYIGWCLGLVLLVERVFRMDIEKSTIVYFCAMFGTLIMVGLFMYILGK